MTFVKLAFMAAAITLLASPALAGKHHQHSRDASPAATSAEAPKTPVCIDDSPTCDMRSDWRPVNKHFHMVSCDEGTAPVMCHYRNDQVSEPTAQTTHAQSQTVVLIDNRCPTYLCGVWRDGSVTYVRVDHLCGGRICGEWHDSGYYVGGFLLAAYNSAFGYDLGYYGFGYQDRHLGYWSPGGCYQRCRDTIRCHC